MGTTACSTTVAFTEPRPQPQRRAERGMKSRRRGLSEYWRGRRDGWWKAGRKARARGACTASYARNEVALRMACGNVVVSACEEEERFMQTRPFERRALEHMVPDTLA